MWVEYVSGLEEEQAIALGFESKEAALAYARTLDAALKKLGKDG